ncbi:putative MyTH4 domain containing protein [Blattamonas nauphoetae]|uniref:MyTH4 domain containing protein n=1 Tax=Blattamonas nauphoetae TaxID=2049346 RepID=A0ABQ9YGD3_9EUKA|nr:putative MyTH4 domain containing protein [Blattamonas nauphoetae]
MSQKKSYTLVIGGKEKQVLIKGTATRKIFTEKQCSLLKDINSEDEFYYHDGIFWPTDPNTDTQYKLMSMLQDEAEFNKRLEEAIAKGKELDPMRGEQPPAAPTPKPEEIQPSPPSDIPIDHSQTDLPAQPPPLQEPEPEKNEKTEETPDPLPTQESPQSPIPEKENPPDTLQPEPQQEISTVETIEPITHPVPEKAKTPPPKEEVKGPSQQSIEPPEKPQLPPQVSHPPQPKEEPKAETKQPDNDDDEELSLSDISIEEDGQFNFDSDSDDQPAESTAPQNQPEQTAPKTSSENDSNKPHVQPYHFESDPVLEPDPTTQEVESPVQAPPPKPTLPASPPISTNDVSPPVDSSASSQPPQAPAPAPAQLESISPSPEHQAEGEPVEFDAVSDIDGEESDKTDVPAPVAPQSVTEETYSIAKHSNAMSAFERSMNKLLPQQSATRSNPFGDKKTQPKDSSTAATTFSGDDTHPNAFEETPALITLDQPDSTSLASISPTTTPDPTKPNQLSDESTPKKTTQRPQSLLFIGELGFAVNTRPPIRVLPLNLAKKVSFYELSTMAKQFFTKQTTPQADESSFLKKIKDLVGQKEKDDNWFIESMQFSMHPLSSPLLSTVPQPLEKEALHLFDCIRLSLTSQGPRRAQLIQTVLETGQKTPILRDELYCQIIKQATNCPNKQYRVQGFELLALACGSFAPSASLLPFLLRFLDKGMFTSSELFQIKSKTSSSFFSSSSTADVQNVNVYPRESYGMNGRSPDNSNESILLQYALARLHLSFAFRCIERISLDRIQNISTIALVPSFVDVTLNDIMFHQSVTQVLCGRCKCTKCDKRERGELEEEPPKEVQHDENGEIVPDFVSILPQGVVNTLPTQQFIIPKVMPAIFQKLIHLNGLKQLGIFRTSATKDNLEIQCQKLKEYDLSFDTVDKSLLAVTLKQWLKLLYTPLIPNDLFDEAIRSCESDEKLDFFVKNRLTPAHMLAFKYLARFTRLLSSPEYVDINKMTKNNIAICFAPNILSTDEEDLVKVAKSTQQSIHFLERVIECIYPTDEELKIFRTMDATVANEMGIRTFFY